MYGYSGFFDPIEHQERVEPYITWNKENPDAENPHRIYPYFMSTDGDDIMSWKGFS